MTTTTYTPRPGTKVELAVKALAAGPLLGSQLASAIGSIKADLPSILAAALEHGFILRVKDRAGLMHYALGGQAIDERFTPYESDGASSHARGRRLADAPIVRAVTIPSITASLDALAAANPFKRSTSLSHHGGEADKSEEGAPCQREAASPPLVAGLFNNGELMISTGEESIKLTPEHTRALFDYLDKITGLIRQTEESAH